MLNVFDADLVQGVVTRMGYPAVFLLVGLESAGLPLPGEAALVSAAVYAATSHALTVPGVILAAAAGAIIGDNLGFWVGRRFGARLLLRHGGRIGLDEGRLKIGQFLFARFGAAIVVAGRFTALLRSTAALLAGVNRYPWGRFLVANGIGGLVWATIYGLGAAAFGRSLHGLSRPAATVLIATVASVVIGLFLLIRRHEGRLREAAERAYPGPLTPMP